MHKSQFNLMVMVLLQIIKVLKYYAIKRFAHTKILLAANKTKLHVLGVLCTACAKPEELWWELSGDDGTKVLYKFPF